MTNKALQRAYAIPTEIMASAFTEELRKRRDESKNTCPHCERI